jgi:hypothetical protein
MKRSHLLAAMALLIGGCASYDGRGLVPGQSAAEVEAVMGAPTERVKAADGDTILFYSRQPFGRQMYAARIAPDGRLRSMEQVLTEANTVKLVPGVSTRAQVLELFGPPYQTSRFERMDREVWTWTIYNINQLDFYLHVQMSMDGIVREVIVLKDYNKEVGDGKS